MNHIIKHVANKFYLGETLDTLYGEIDYEIDDKNRLVVTHTYVNPNYRGQGLANLLLDEVIKLATDQKQFIVPLCSFAYKVLHSSDKYAYLLDPMDSENGPNPCEWKPK